MPMNSVSEDQINNRVKALIAKRMAVKAQIEEARKSPSTPSEYIRQLRKENLFYKDEIESLRRVTA